MIGLTVFPNVKPNITKRINFNICWHIFKIHINIISGLLLKYKVRNTPTKDRVCSMITILSKIGETIFKLYFLYYYFIYC